MSFIPPKDKIKGLGLLLGARLGPGLGSVLRVKDRVRTRGVFRVRVRFLLSIQWRGTGRHLTNVTLI